ncbi:2,3-diaminopropionate biosynthesis protein SbnB [Streptomyces sp. NBC_00201]|uniref:2,3-diaminopropionate biosynthesis protein SbnB n=1 Tax=unclassified Streptomyces TaxID=2593676 RepID=UPI0022537059|nr:MULTISPECIES: 2,3-diaminopropionate biosynthesis protein SbnB [unclassified Streptomyces]MCX5245557.1 2,3-diaminopropionate biosynthesis protein SbnB [Streptomyces sp. NBC_00201]
MLIIRQREVREILDGREHDLIDLVGEAYAAHAQGASVLPHSVFLRFPDDVRKRIIGLPGYLGGAHESAGVKWIASFPGNLDVGLERASAVMVLNSPRTGRAQALLEASLISAKRTAASAALGAALLVPAPERVRGVGLVGAGVINAEILAFLAAKLPALAEVTVFDQDAERARSFIEKAAGRLPELRYTIAATISEALGAHELVSLATTAATPHTGLEACQPGATVLHISLRDIHPDAIRGAHNVVDDTDHVLREKTSLDLARQEAGNQDFVDAQIGDLLTKRTQLRRDPGRVAVYSPFGLGVLDLAVARLVFDSARERGSGVAVTDFLDGTDS